MKKSQTQTQLDKRIIGFENKVIESMRYVFGKYPQIEQVKIYGSRANGTFHEKSDVNLVIMGPPLDPFDLAKVMMDLDDNIVSCRVDLKNYQTLNNPKLMAKIDAEGVLLFDRTKA